LGRREALGLAELGAAEIIPAGQLRPGGARQERREEMPKRVTSCCRAAATKRRAAF